MKLLIETEKTFTIMEDERIVIMTFSDEGTCTHFSSTLPYQKSKSDWDFYQKAIKRILKELKRG